VVALWRYPVKSMQGEALQIAQVRDHGLLGDRAYALLDRADSMVTSNRPTLYERLGGVYRIATVVDDLIDWVMDDPRLNANPQWPWS
jgi:MOSC N-terminal beta barrel domain